MKYCLFSVSNFNLFEFRFTGVFIVTIGFVNETNLRHQANIMYFVGFAHKIFNRKGKKPCRVHGTLILLNG